jgi:hypothetical protein
LRKLRPWLGFAAWAVAGTLYAVGIAGILTIGIFVLPVAVLVMVLIARNEAAKAGWPGLITGIGVVPLVIAYLNRGGPGMVCTTTATSGSCTQEFNPWIFIAAAVVLVTVGIVIQAVRLARPSPPRGPVVPPPGPWGPDAPPPRW